MCMNWIHVFNLTFVLEILEMPIKVCRVNFCGNMLLNYEFAWNETNQQPPNSTMSMLSPFSRRTLKIRLHTL